jgi:hypothetical protein
MKTRGRPILAATPRMGHSSRFRLLVMLRWANS